MKLEIKQVCRGDGKAFLAVEARRLDDEALVAFCAFTAAGDAVPLSVFEPDGAEAVGFTSRKRSFVIAVPLLERDLTLTCHAFAPDGSLLAQQSVVVTPQAVKWLGRANAALDRDGAIAKMRDCDRNRTLGRVVFSFWDYLAVIGRDGILRGTAFVPQRLCDQPPTIRCFDGSMREYAEAVIVTGAKVVSSSDAMSAPLWEVSFSARVPHDRSVLICAAYGSDGFPLPGFDALEQHGIAHLCERVAYQYGNAQWDPGYDGWFHAHRTGQSELALQRRRTYPAGLTFSIIVPLFRTPPALFDAMVASVKSQTYPHWELVLVNASPESVELAAAVARECAADARIVEVPLPENRGITLNTNAGIERATGDFICFFDHDDVLEPDILFEYAKAIGEHPETDMLYCDEDKLQENGLYAQPFFKPDFSIDLLRSNNFVCHMLAIRASLLETVPPQTDEFDGAQDHNLTLLVSEKARSIHHVPKVLYHWRMAAGSTASDEGNKTYAQDAGIRAVEAHLTRLGIAGTVTPATLPFTYRTDYAVTGEPLVSIVIPNKDHIDLLGTCLASIFDKTTYRAFEVVVIENNSVDPATFAYYGTIRDTWDNARVVTWPGTGFSYSDIVNYGVGCARGEYVVLLNNDIEVITPEWIDLMLGCCQRDDVGAVGAKLYYPDGTVQHAGVGITGETAEHIGKFLDCDDQGYFGLLGLMRNVSAVTAACMMTKRSAYEAVGGLDPRLAVAYNDVDYCLKLIDAGYLVVMNPFVELYHYESVSRGREDENLEKEARARRETAYLHEKWADLYVKGDPFLNPNLNPYIPFARYYRLK